AGRILSVGKHADHRALTKDQLIASLKKSDQVYRENGTVQEVDTTKIGVSKDEFFAAIRATETLGMTFPLVFLESCGSGIRLSDAADGVPNIGYLISSDLRGIGYENIDFAAVDASSDIGVFQSYFSQLSSD